VALTDESAAISLWAFIGIDLRLLVSTSTSCKSRIPRRSSLHERADWTENLLCKVSSRSSRLVVLFQKSSAGSETSGHYMHFCFFCLLLRHNVILVRNSSFEPSSTIISQRSIIGYNVQGKVHIQRRYDPPLFKLNHQ
jgi:hypothetical protein